MADQDFNIKIGTTANTSGAEKTGEALKDVAQQAKETAAATEAAVNTNPMALPESLKGSPRDEIAEQEEAERSLTETMEEAQAAAEKLRQDQAELDVARAKASQAAREQANAERNVEAALQQASTAARRMAGQLTALASAELAKGLAQVNPELAGIAASTAQGAAAAGPWGAALGALVGSMGAVKQAWEEYQKVIKETEEKIRKNNEALGEHMEKVTQLRLSKGYEKQWGDLSVMIDGVNQAIRDNIELENARRQATASMSTNARQAQESIIKAQRDSGLLSEQKAQTQLAALKAQEAEANKQEAIAEAQARQKEREADLQAAQTQLQAIQDRKEVAQRELAAAQKKLDEFLVDPFDREKSSMERGKIVGELQAAEQEAKAADDGIKAALDKVTAVQNEVQKGAQLLQIEIETIGQEFDMQGVQDAAKELGEKSKEVMQKGAQGIQEAIEGVVPQNRLQEENLAALNKAISDGELDAKEASAAVQQLASLNGLLKTEFGKIVGVVQQTQSDLSTITVQISNLASRQQTISDQVKDLARSLPAK
jgi:chromosome segregation ATPase